MQRRSLKQKENVQNEGVLNIEIYSKYSTGRKSNLHVWCSVQTEAIDDFLIPQVRGVQKQKMMLDFVQQPFPVADVLIDQIHRARLHTITKIFFFFFR